MDSVTTAANTRIRLIVGLGNPGPDYEKTRHNAGAWLIEQLTHAEKLKLHTEIKFKGRLAKLVLDDQECWLLIPNTFMNLSGQSVSAVAKFYKINPAEILVAHDELDFPPGVIRLKKGGGVGGHNGLKDIAAHLQTPDFYRLRIGIGHPGDRDAVLNYVLGIPSKNDVKLIHSTIERALPFIPDLVKGDMAKVMQYLHTHNLLT